MALSPDWKNLPRRKCDDCGKSYKPTRPRRILNGKEELGFCCDNCRKSYHKHGGAYRKLKAEMQKMVSKELAALEKRVREIVREELERADFYDVESRPVSVITHRPEPPALTKMKEECSAKAHASR